MSYYHFLPGILGQAGWAFLLFALLLASGVIAFGRSLGTPARASAVPLLAIPPVEDLIRFLLHCSFKSAWLAAILLWIGFVLIRLGLSRSWFQPLPRLLFSRRWQLALLVALLLHLVLRLWIFTGHAPNPRDDLWGGFKANALFNSTGWPTPNPEIPELGFPYYYFVYMWPAGLAAWFHLSLWAAWWPTIIVFSTVGTLLIMELWLPYIHSKLGMAAAAVAATVGASAVLPLDLIFRLPPKGWMEWGFLPRFFIPADLYLQVPTQMQAIEAPFDVFCSGVLLTVTWMILRSWHRPPNWSYYLYLILGIGALCGYCTFYLMGYLFVILPALFVVALRDGPLQLRRRFLPLALCGGVSLILSWPLFSEELHRRGHSVLVSGTDPLYLWVPKHPSPFGLIWLVIAILILLVLLNPLGAWASFAPARSSWARLLRWIFLWGCLTCLWGADGYVLKMGTLISLAGVALFVVQVPRQAKTVWRLAALCLLGPSLILLNNVRANATVEKIDPVWEAIDRAALDSGTAVFFPSGKAERLVPYFSRARMMGVSDEVDPQYADYLSDVDALKKLPPWLERLRRLNPGSSTYLRLQTAGSPNSSSGTIIYQDSSYILTRETFPESDR